MSWTSSPQFETELWDYLPPPPHVSGYYGYGNTPFDQYGGRYQSSGIDSGLRYPKLEPPPLPQPPPPDGGPQGDPLPNAKLCTLQRCTCGFAA